MDIKQNPEEGEVQECSSWSNSEPFG